MYKRILMPIDGSPNSEFALEWGIRFAKALNAEVTFLHIIETPVSIFAAYNLPSSAFYLGDLVQDMRAAGKSILANAKAQAEALDVTCNATMLEDKQPARAILEAEEAHHLSVMATHSRQGLDRLFLGSVTEGVLRRSDKPHLILHGPDEGAPTSSAKEQFEHFLLPIDGSDASDSAVEEGLGLARSLGARVTFLHALEVPVTVYAMTESMVYEPSIREELKKAGQESLEKAASRALELGVEAEVRLVDSPNIRAETAILEAEGAFDLTVMATHGRQGLNRALLGSVTERVLRQSSVPHLIVKCEEELSP